MANPAELLLAQLESWNTANVTQSPASRRGLETDITEALRRHELAMSHIGEIRQLLDAIETARLFPVDDYRRELPAWTQMVLSHPDGWRTPQPVRGFGQFNAASLTLLRTLIPQLDRLVPSWNAEQRQGFADAVEELLTTLRDDPSIRGQLAEYLLTLILHMRQVLAEYDLRGDFALSRALWLLKASVYTASEASTDEKSKTKWEWFKSIFTWAPEAQKAIEWVDVFQQLTQ